MRYVLAVNRLFCTRMTSMPRKDNAACAALHISTFLFAKKIKLKISVTPIWFGEKKIMLYIPYFLFLQFWFDCCCINSKDGRTTACATFLIGSEPFAVAATSIARISYNCYSKSCLQASATSPVRGEPLAVAASNARIDATARATSQCYFSRQR